ncbi:MAG TPA: hypothetical protein VIK52_12105 [Opitutaceae bacterium]
MPARPAPGGPHAERHVDIEQPEAEFVVNKLRGIRLLCGVLATEAV